MSPLFTPTKEEIDGLVATHPLAQIVSLSSIGLMTTPLPLLLQRKTDGGITLLGHFARANPHVAELEERPDALAIFMGPHGYISPSWFTDRTQAPTWNFASLHMAIRVVFDPSLAAAREAVDTLTEHMEQGRASAWSRTDMGERYERLIPHIVAFRADVVGVIAKFKLGQNERLDVLGEAIAGVYREGNSTLGFAMQQANRHRRP